MRGRGLSRRVAAVAFVGVGALAVAGCGAGGNVLESVADKGATVTPTASPAFVAQSAERTAAIETGHIEVVVTADGGTATITGQFDTTRPAAAATLTATGFASELGDISAELVYADDAVFVKPDGLASLFGATAGTPWLKFSTDGAGSLTDLFPGGAEVPTVDPAQILDDLEAEGIQVTEVGSEDVRGVATTHYAVVIPADAGGHGGPATNADVWIDADGLVRRVEVAATGDAAFTVRAELFDLGSSVSIAAPPADQVTDLSSLGGEGGLFGPKPR